MVKKQIWKFINKVRYFFGAVYVRFMLAFLGTFLISLILPAVGMNFVQKPNVENYILRKVEKKSMDLKRLMDSGDFRPEEAASIIRSEDVNIELVTDLANSQIILNEEERQRADNGEIVVFIENEKESHWSAVFQVDNMWFYMYTNERQSPMGAFSNMQIYFVVVPMVLGTILLFFTSYSVARPIKRLSVAFKRLSKGDMTVQVNNNGSGEIKDLLDNFNTMVKELNKNEYLHKEFVSNVSHEFNTPITSIKGYAKLIQKTLNKEDKRSEYAEIIIMESERLSGLSKDLLKLSELENQGYIRDKKKYRLDEQIRSAVVLLQNNWENKNIEMDLDLSEVTYVGEESLMYQVWVNLITNAIKYNMEKGTITITLKKEEQIHFEIKDTGVGMDEEECKKAFNRFYKADRSRNSGGSGLGLSIVKRIVELHDGKIDIKSSPENGTKITVILPVCM